MTTDAPTTTAPRAYVPPFAANPELARAAAVQSHASRREAAARAREDRDRLSREIGALVQAAGGSSNLAPIADAFARERLLLLARAVDKLRAALEAADKVSDIVEIARLLGQWSGLTRAEPARADADPEARLAQRYRDAGVQVPDHLADRG